MCLLTGEPGEGALAAIVAPAGAAVHVPVNGSALEGDPAHQLDISRLRNRAIPSSEIRAGGIVIKRCTITERLPITSEVVVVEHIECFGANLEVQVLFGIPIWRPPNRTHTRPGAEVISIREGCARFERGGVESALVHVERAPRLGQYVSGDGGNALSLELRRNPADG